MRKRLLIIAVMLISSLLVSCATMESKGLQLTTDKEIKFDDVRFGTTYAEMGSLFSPLKKILNSSLSDYRLFTPIGINEDIEGNSFPYLSEEKFHGAYRYNLRAIPSKMIVVGGYDVGHIIFYFSAISLDGRRQINDPNKYQLYAGSYSFQYGDYPVRADEGKVTKKPLGTGMATYNNLKDKLTVLYGEPYIITGNKKVSNSEGSFTSCYAIWLGSNNTGVKLSYIPSQDKYGADRTLVTSCSIYITYGRTDMYDIVYSILNPSGYEGL